MPDTSHVPSPSSSSPLPPSPANLPDAFDAQANQSPHTPLNSPLPATDTLPDPINHDHHLSLLHYSTISRHPDVPPRPMPSSPTTPPTALPASRTHRSSYLDMDDDDDAPKPSSSRTSVLSPLRRLLNGNGDSSKPSPVSTPPAAPSSGNPPDHPASSLPAAPPRLDLPPRSSDEQPLLPATFPSTRRSEESSRPFPSMAFTFPLSSPPPSSPSSSITSRRMRPSLEGVFDSPSPPPRTSREFTTAAQASGPQRESVALSSKSATSSTSTKLRPRRHLPSGENPLIFGNVAPRRISKSTPLSGSPPPEHTHSIRPPALSVTSPTPASSSTSIAGPSTMMGIIMDSSLGKRPSPPKSVTYQDEVGSSTMRRGKRKSDELLSGVDENGRITHDKRRSSLRGTNSTSATPPSAFSTGGSGASGHGSGASRRSNSKRVKLSPGSDSGQDPTTNASHHQQQSTNTEVSSQHQPRPSTPRPASLRPSTTRTYRSTSSFPLSAIVTPRAPSTGFYGLGEEGLYMRDPRRAQTSVGWKVRYSPKNIIDEKNNTVQKERSVLPALLFYPGFILPFLWCIGALIKFNKEKGSEKWDAAMWDRWRRREREFKTWRDRCRFMAILSLVTYLPLVVLLAIFIPK